MLQKSGKCNDSTSRGTGSASQLVSERRQPTQVSSIRGPATPAGGSTNTNERDWKWVAFFAVVILSVVATGPIPAKNSSAARKLESPPFRDVHEEAAHRIVPPPRSANLIRADSIADFPGDDGDRYCPVMLIPIRSGFCTITD
jgi:hypothetical protein